MKPRARIIHSRNCSADLRVCCIAGFQARSAYELSGPLPTWKSAIQQAGKPALRGFHPSVAFSGAHYEICRLASVILIVILLATGGSVAIADDTPASLTDFKSYQAIIDHSIFDPTRRKGVPAGRSEPRRPPTESFTLIGTMSSAQGALAFFNGTTSDFRKTAKCGDRIAGYKIEEIAHEYVKLGAGSNKTINLPMLTQMSRREGGPWSIGPRGESTEVPAAEMAATSPPSTSMETKPSDSPAKSDAISDVMKRLMQKRQEEK